MPSAGCFLFGQAALLAVGLPSAWAAGRSPPFRHGVTSTDPSQLPGHVETGFLSLRAGVAVRPDPLPWPGLLHYVGQFLGQFLVAGYSQVDWIRTPEVRQVLFRYIFVLPDGGARADHFIVLYPFAACQIIHPAVNVSQSGSHAGPVPLFPKVGNMGLVQAAFGGAVPRQRRQDDFLVVASGPEEQHRRVEDLKVAPETKFVF